VTTGSVAKQRLVNRARARMKRVMAISRLRD
jgi:hypothetical protein